MMKTLKDTVKQYIDYENRQAVIERLNSGLEVYVCEDGHPIRICLDYFKKNPTKRYYLTLNECMASCK